MKKQILLTISFIILLFGSNKIDAQNIIYSDTFVSGTTYGAGSRQTDDWVSFRSLLDTTTQTLLKVTMKGTFDQTGRSCTDRAKVRQIAQALRNGSTFSVACDGINWSMGTCGAGIDLTVGGTGTNLGMCYCNNGWSIRPNSGVGTNWGGITTATCGSPTQRMTLIFEKPSKPNDMGVVAMTRPDLCNYTQTLIARISNFGTTRIDSFRLYWTINGVLQTPQYINSRLARNRDTSITLFNNYNFTANTNYRFRVWTHRPNNLTDSIAENDTLRFSFFFLGNPNAPSVTNFTQCGNGFPRLVATPNTSIDSVMWFTQSTGGSLLGIGRNIQGPYLTQSRTFYAQAAKFGGKITLTPTASTAVNVNQNVPYGGMLSVTVNKRVVLDSLLMRMWYNVNNTSLNYQLYYRIGTFSGFQTSPGSWTLLTQGPATLFQRSGLNYARVNADNFVLEPSNTYSFYFVATGNCVACTNNGPAVSDANMTIAGGGSIIIGQFGSTQVLNNWHPEMSMVYRTACESSTRTPLTVTVKPRPTGAEIVTGTPFQGQIKLGLPSNPDIIELGKTLTYQLNPPTGFINGDHNITWTVNNVVARTRGGVIVPATEYTVVQPSGSGPGKITYIPKSAFLDSFITFRINYSDLGPYFCDSTVVRTLVVAPTPKTNFKFPASICLGEATLFENTTTIHSGNNTFVWHFGNSDTSDLNSPVYEYQQGGTYNVRLVATSFPWKVVKDTTIVVEVGDLPNVFFRVNNKCQGNAVTFVNGTTVANGTLTYNWNFGDGSPVFSTSSSSVPPKTYTTPGLYKVTLTADANGCKSSLTKNAYLFPRPVPNFTAPTTPVCANTTIDFKNTSTIASGQQGAIWNLNAGFLTTESNPSYAYLTPNTYQVTLVAVSEFECKDSIKKSVTIIPSPKPNFVADQFCDKKPTNFTNTSVEALSNPVYTWTMSDGFTSQSKSVANKTWSISGNIDVNLHSKYSNGCESTTTKQVQVLIQPVADFDVEDICSGEVARFVNKTKSDQAGVKYAWDLGNGTDNVAAPVRVYNNPTTTTYTVKLAASYDGGCGDTMVKSLTVSESPSCDFGFSNQGFLGYRFTPSNSGYTKYEWFMGEGGYQNVTNPSGVLNYNYAYPGNFKVTMKATNSAGCECEITKTVSATTEVKDINAMNGVKIYPNPNNGTFVIQNTNNSGMQVEIYNVLGAKVYSKTTETNSLNVSLEGESKGVYLVKVTINGVTSITKITLVN